MLHAHNHPPSMCTEDSRNNSHFLLMAWKFDMEISNHRASPGYVKFVNNSCCDDLSGVKRGDSTEPRAIELIDSMIGTFIFHVVYWPYGEKNSYTTGICLKFLSSLIE